MDAQSSSKGRLAGKVCLITGGARGIGAATAHLSAREGAKVAVADLKDTLGESVVSAIKQGGGEAVYWRCDVTDQAAVRELVESVVAKYGPVDVLFNNVG